MRVLITGANGQLGRALQKFAPVWADINAIDIEDCDLADLSMLRARLTVEAPDLIINAAAYSDIDSAESDVELCRAINVDAVTTMVEALADTGGKMVQVSSVLVFDGRRPVPYLPSDERNPLSTFGRAKAESENRLRPGDLLVRTAWVYESGGDNFVRTMLSKMSELDEVTAVFDQVRAPTWASGLAHTIWGLVERKACGIYHHCDAGAVSPYEFAVAIAEEAVQLGLIARMPVIKPISSADCPTLAQRPAFSILDCHDTRSALGDEGVHWRVNLRLMLEEEVRLA